MLFASCRLLVQKPALVSYAHSVPAGKGTDLDRHFVQAARDRCIDMVQTHFAEKVAIVIGTAGKDANQKWKMYWKVCSVDKTNGDCSFAIFVGEYIDAVNSMKVQNPKVYRLLPVKQALRNMAPCVLQPIQKIEEFDCDDIVDHAPKTTMEVLHDILKRTAKKLIETSQIHILWRNFRGKNTQAESQREVEMTVIDSSTKKAGPCVCDDNDNFQKINDKNLILTTNNEIYDSQNKSKRKRTLIAPPQSQPQIHATTEVTTARSGRIVRKPNKDIK